MLSTLWNITHICPNAHKLKECELQYSSPSKTGGGYFQSHKEGSSSLGYETVIGLYHSSLRTLKHPLSSSSSSSSWRRRSVVSVLLQQMANHYKPCITLSYLSSSSSLAPSLSFPPPPQHLLSHIRSATCLQTPKPSWMASSPPPATCLL